MSSTRVRSDWMNDPRNLVIALLTVATLLLGGALGRDHLAGLGTGSREPAEGEPTAVLDLVLDREGLAYLDFLLDRPVGAEHVGEIVPDAATIRPATGGTWRWEGANVLRFEPAGGFEMAMRYEFALVGSRVLPSGGHLAGETTFEVVTDQFQIERIDTFQEPTPAGDGIVVRGSARFNYEVDPEALATHMRLIDPLLGDSEPVPLLLETYYDSRIIEFRSEPLRKEREARELRLDVGAELTPAYGNVPLPADFVEHVTIGSSERLAVWDVESTPGDPESRLRIRLSSPVDAAVAARFLSVAPAIAYRVSSQRNELTLTGAFEPGAEYTVQIAEGLAARDEARLDAAYEYTLRLPDLEPALGFESQGMFLSASGQQHLAIDAVNADLGDLVVERVYRNNLFYLFDSYSWMVWDQASYSGSAIDHSLGDRVAQVELSTAGPRNRRQNMALDLGSYVDAGVPGLYRVAIARRGDYRAQQRWVMVTDLGLVAKQGEGEVLVWASSFASLQPVANARVRLVSDQNQTLAEGRTDAAGLWRFEGDWQDARPYLITVERGDDFSFLLFDAMGVDTTGLDVGGASSSDGGYEAFMYGERDIYRPGETVEGVGIVRDRRLRPPPSMPLLLRHIDPTGLEGETRRVDLGAGGMAPFSVEIPEFARTGRHSLELLAAGRVIGRYGVQVEEFVPDRIRVQIDPASSSVAAGAGMSFEVGSNYLFGPPAAGLPVEASVRLEPALFVAEGFEDYSFVAGDRRYPGAEIFAADGRLDDDGTARFETGLPDGLRVPSSLEAVITARAREEGGRGVSARTRVPVHPYPYYLGLRRSGSGYAEPGVAETFAFVAVDPAGAPAVAGGLRAELFKEEWQTVLRRTASGTFRYESSRDSRLIDTVILDAGQSAGQFEMLPEQFGSYRVVISDPLLGPAAEVGFTASGAGFSPWAIANPARIDLELDREEYTPGESARVQVRAPFGGRLLVTVERNGVQWSRALQMGGNTATIDVPVTALMRPNAYITATVIRSAADLEPGSVARAFGATPVAVDRGSNRLAVELSHADEIRPGTALQIEVNAVPGASVTVAAVDEGILQLIAQPTPDPFEFFYRKLALGVRSFDTYSLLFPEVSLPVVNAVGGGAAADAMPQFVGTGGIRRARPVAFWSGVLLAGADGTARASFDVPSFQGALRVMAVGSDGRRFGAGSGLVTVRDPLVLLPTVPRFLATGDEVSIPISVRNDTGSGGDIEIGLGATLPGAAESTARQTVSVRDGDEELTYFPLTVGGETGVAELQITASGLGESTAVSERVPIRPDLPDRTDELVGALTEPVTDLEPAGAFFRSGATRSLHVSRLPMVQLSGRFDYLVRYPYGCLEQVTSSAFPLIHLGELAQELDPELFGASGSSAVLVQQAIRKIRDFQTYSGGFSLWPAGSELQPWASVYATHFLVESRAAGFLVPDALFDRALGFVRAEARARGEYAWDELQRVAYALYVLARAGQADLGTMDFLRQRHLEGMGSESRTLLAAAYAAVGNSTVMRQLLDGAGEVEAIARQTGGNFNSEIRNRALALLAMQQADPSDTRIPETARRLTREATSLQPWSTQETAFALLALGQFYSSQVERGEYSGQVLVDGVEQLRFDSGSSLVTALPATGAVSIRMDTGFNGGAFYALRSRGVPTEASYRAEQNGIQLRRALLTRTGGIADLDAIQQGDLLVVRLMVRSTSGPLDNVVVQNLLPAGLEVENPRLSSTETLPWVTDADLFAEHLDLRDDRIVLFTSLPDEEWRTGYALVRAVSPGLFRMPPAQAEAMYDPQVRATVGRGRIRIQRR